MVNSRRMVKRKYLLYVFLLMVLISWGVAEIGIKDAKNITESKYSFGEVNVPYIPGCLAFRELPFTLDTIPKLESNPDLYIFDGNGYLHPRHMGIVL